jgi:hypothetical protein
LRKVPVLVAKVLETLLGVKTKGIVDLVTDVRF